MSPPKTIGADYPRLTSYGTQCVTPVEPSRFIFITVHDTQCTVCRWTYTAKTDNLDFCMPTGDTKRPALLAARWRCEKMKYHPANRSNAKTCAPTSETGVRRFPRLIFETYGRARECVRLPRRTLVSSSGRREDGGVHLADRKVTRPLWYTSYLYSRSRYVHPQCFYTRDLTPARNVYSVLVSLQASLLCQ